MYNYSVLPIRPVAADEMLDMPIDILLALPDYLTRSGETTFFNLPGAINDLMGGAGWERAVKVMNPRVWAPQWDDERLREFVTAPFGRDKRRFPDLPMESMRAANFPSIRTPSSVNLEVYEIIHFVGNALMLAGDQPTLDLGIDDSGDERRLSAGALRDTLVAARTRLLILQNPMGEIGLPPETYEKHARLLAEFIVEGGGPPVLIVAGGDAPRFNRYFQDLYANIIHNLPLPSAAQPAEEITQDILVHLLYGQGGDELLQFDHLRTRLYGRVQTVRETVEPITERPVSVLFSQMRPYLHRSQIRALEERITMEDEEIGRVASRVLGTTLTLNRELDFSHETGGVIPVSEIAEALPAVEAEAKQLSYRYPQVIEELSNDLNREARRAPRVLNAAFADPREGRVLEPRDPLIVDREYDLLVDVGPQWKKIKSYVIGHKDFPEDALPPDEEDGYLINVVLISDDLKPNICSGWIWVPRHTGGSFPYDAVKKQKAEESGPLASRVTVSPVVKKDERVTQVRGRLCLYYENNLLQSAIVNVGVARTSAVLEVDHVVEVDYVLSGTIQRLERFATRALKFTDTDEKAEYPVAVNVTLNSDGGIGHRVLVRQLDGQQPSSDGTSLIGWTPYDPAAAAAALNRARDDLKSCFHQRNENNGEVIGDDNGTPIIGLDANNGKTKSQFLWDLLILAKLGAKLFDSAFGQVTPVGDWQTQAQWARALQQTLKTSSIIQVSRTAPANYVFPWALIYEYPMPGPKARFEFCKVTEEWSADGRRTAPLARTCPYRDEGWHTQNIICPYGFWGLKHIIEQPLSALRKLDDGTYVLGNTPTRIRFDSNLDLSVGVTHDLLKVDRDAHLKRLGQIQGMRINPPDPADDMDKVRAMLKATAMVYFLCHGEYDAAEQEPYLGIGLRDDNPIHRIYPKTLQSWARTPDLEAWQKRHPLVFINGCHTANLAPGEVLNFVTAFTFAGASGVIGTEVSVLLPVAIEIAESLFNKVTQPMPVGQAMHQIRWALANKGNLLGLAYTLYCMADLQVVGD